MALVDPWVKPPEPGSTFRSPGGGFLILPSPPRIEQFGRLFFIRQEMPSLAAGGAIFWYWRESNWWEQFWYTGSNCLSGTLKQWNRGWKSDPGMATLYRTRVQAERELKRVN